jgi:hypothetical protein
MISVLFSHNYTTANDVYFQVKALQLAKSKAPFKSVQEVDAHITYVTRPSSR